MKPPLIRKALHRIRVRILREAAARLSKTMPSSRLPTGPQLEAWTVLALGDALRRRGIRVMARSSVPGTATFRVSLRQRSDWRGSWIDIYGAKHHYRIVNSWCLHEPDGCDGSVLTHEVDVAVVHAGREDDWTHAASLVAGIECKQYAAPVPINVVRTVVGTDLVLWRAAQGRKAHGRHTPVHRLWGICTTGGGASHAQRLSDKYDITWIPLLAREDGILTKKMETFAKLLERRLQW